VDEAQWAFLRGGPWADFIRPARPGNGTEVFKGPEITRFHRSVWHYIDVPWVPPWDRKSIDPTTLPSRVAAAAPSTNPNEPRNILEAYAHNAKILASREASPADRAVALAWLEHLVGDIHQPLHACSLYSTVYPEGDKGGNDQAVRANGEVVRLHAYWDTALGTSDAYLAIDFLARLIADDPALAKPKLFELAGDESFQSWIDESHELAIAVVHLNGRLRSARYPAFEAKQIAEGDVPPLPASYDANSRDVSKRRVALAGHRLATTIREVLSAAAPPAPR
jgi:hypothetical protein